MTREEQIKKAWESAFKNIVESIDTERTREEVACIFFELGCRWADETMIDKACLYLKEALINTRDNFGYAVVASFDTIDLDGFIEEFRKELKGE